jgi:hypothetical protein
VLAREGPFLRVAGTIVGTAGCSSAERERERLHTGIEELDLELAIGDRSRLTNQLIQALLGEHPLEICMTLQCRWIKPPC